MGINSESWDEEEELKTLAFVWLLENRRLSFITSSALNKKRSSSASDQIGSSSFST